LSCYTSPTAERIVPFNTPEKQGFYQKTSEFLTT
jgi:hypothetical protein